MNDTVVVAGIDVSKDKLDVHVLPSNLVFTVSRDQRGLTDLVGRLRHAGVDRIALEASGDYERIVLVSLDAEGLRVQLLNPLRVRRFAEAEGTLAKTDPIDARLIARYAQHFPDKGLVRRPESARKLGEFLTMRTMLLGMLGEVRNRLEHLDEPGLRALAESIVVQTKAQIAEVDAGIDTLIRDDDAMAHKARLIRSFIGAGPVLTTNLLARVPELGSVNRHQAARLAGIAPGDRKSGRIERPSTIERGRHHLRPVLHMVALAAIRRNPAIAAFAKRLTAAGKPKRLVLAACARKVIVTLNAMLRDQTPWRPQHAA